MGQHGESTVLAHSFAEWLACQGQPYFTQIATRAPSLPVKA